MFTDNDDCDYLSGIPDHPFAGVSVQTVPEPWSFRLAGGDCGGDEDNHADHAMADARRLTSAMIELLPYAATVCESVGKVNTARTLAALLMDAHRVNARLVRAGAS